jgi:hypothetical protein
MERPIIVFNHIPKTAGTTLRFILTQNYSPDEMLFVDNYYQLPEMREAMQDNERRRRLKLVYGHGAYNFAVEYAGPTQVVTFLREPFQRLVSHYHYAQRVQEDLNHPYSSLSLEDFVRATHMDDYQVRQLAFPKTRELIPDTLDKRGLLYRAATENLRNRVTFVGIVEKFEESVVMLRDHLKWSRLPLYVPLMVNDQIWKTSHSEEERKRMLDVYLPLERILYDDALRQHENIWAANEARYESDLKELHSQGRVLNELLAQRDLMQRQLEQARARKMKESKSFLA